MMNLNSRYELGVRYGLITGLIYIVLLFLRYHFTSSNPVFFGLLAIVSYVVILLFFLFTGIERKKQLGGTAEMKDIFQAIFIAILITELCYVLFNWIYFKFIDPAFWEKLRTASLVIIEKAGLTQDQIDEKMKNFKDVDQQTKPLGLIKGYGTSVVVDSIFGLIFASILRTKKPVIISEVPKK
jgi:amino acid transporter